MSGHELLAGNGVALLRERALAGTVQSALERLYRLDRVADVGDFVHGGAEGEREALLLHEADDGVLEMRLRLPVIDGEAELDVLCQIIEGVSHFVYVVERARAGREATQLELEMQAEVDKWVILGASMRERFGEQQSAALREKLYERVEYDHDGASELGERYRLANDTAHRFVRRLERKYLRRLHVREMRAELVRFFHVGQEEKLRLGRAA